MKHQAGIAQRQTIDDTGDKSGSDCNRGSDPQFSGGWIGEEANVFDALRKLVENRDATLQERAAVGRRLDPLGAAIKEANAKRALKVGDRS